MREIAETTPNDGLIRLYSALSGEVLVVTNPSSIRDFLAAKAFDFGHQELVQLAIKRFTGSNLGFLSTEDFKVRNYLSWPLLVMGFTLTQHQVAS